jgi:glycosyltransferase involved in cell wall biosynthesis
VHVRLLIMNVHGGGGTSRTVVNQANALSELHDVEVVSVLTKGRRPKFPISKRVRVRSLVDLRERVPLTLKPAPSLLTHHRDSQRGRFSPATDVALLRYLRSLDGGVVMGTRPTLNLAIARWAPPGLVRVGQEHLNLPAHHPSLRAAISAYYPRLDAVVTLTDGDASAYSALLGDSTRVVSMPNGVVTSAATVSPLTEPRIIAVGRLREQKGYHRLIDAFAAVAADRPAWSLTIWGGGSLRETLQEQIDRLGLAQRITLGGFTRDIAAEMGAASVFAMSSRREGLPMAMLEAMGSGLAMVSFDCPTGPRDLIDDGVDGLLVPEGDVPGLAAALARVMDDPDLRHRLGTAARAKADTYGTAALARRWDELLVSLAADHDGVRRQPPPGRHYLPLSWLPLPAPRRR